jgi:PPOX class probable F420-dependent enzyme
VTVELEAWQRDLVEFSRVARLATLNPDGAPHLVVVCFAEVDGRFVIPVDEKPKRSTRLARLRNIERDSRVSLLFDHYDEDWTQLAWLRLDGRAEILEHGPEIAPALTALRIRYVQYLGMSLETLPLIVVEPVRATAWRWQA